MLNRRHFTQTMALAVTAGMLPASAGATDSDHLDAGLPATKQLLLLMDVDKSGKVSRQEFMSFMTAEFDRLDINHDGELDLQELSAMQRKGPSGGHR